MTLPRLRFSKITQEMTYWKVKGRKEVATQLRKTVKGSRHITTRAETKVIVIECCESEWSAFAQ